MFAHFYYYFEWILIYYVVFVYTMEGTRTRYDNTLAPGLGLGDVEKPQIFKNERAREVT